MKSILEFINNQQTSFKNLNPNQFLDFMKDIKYDNFTDEEKYIIKTPQELLRTKKGICYDQVELEREYFKSNKYEFKTFFAYEDIDIESNPTHTFLIFKDNDKYFWFENSWQSYKGIMGPFSSYNEAVEFVKKQLITSSKWKTVNIKEYDKFNYSKMNINQFASYIIDTKKISYQQTPKQWIIENVKHPKNNCFFYAGVISILFNGQLKKGPPGIEEETSHFWTVINNKIYDPTEKQYDFKYKYYNNGVDVDVNKNIDYIINDRLFKTLYKNDQEYILNYQQIELIDYDLKFHKTIPENPDFVVPLDSFKIKHTILYNGEKAGICALKDLSYTFWQIRIHPKFRGLGILEKSVKLLAQKYNKKEIVAAINKENIVSIKAHEKAGFKRDIEKEQNLNKQNLLNPENNLYSKKI